MKDRTELIPQQAEPTNDGGDLPTGGEFPRQILAYMLLRHIERLTRWRIENGRPHHRDNVLGLIARVLASNPSPQAGKGATAWPGLTYQSMIRRARACLIELPDEDEFRLLEQQFDGSNRTYIRPDVAARALSVTRAERDAVHAATGKHLTAIGSVDEDADERKARRQAAKNRRKAEIRRQNGMVPRSAYEGSSRSRTKPWDAEGVSRATFYRRLKAGKTGISHETSAGAN